MGTQFPKITHQPEKCVKEDVLNFLQNVVPTLPKTEQSYEIVYAKARQFKDWLQSTGLIRFLTLPRQATLKQWQLKNQLDNICFMFDQALNQFDDDHIKELKQDTDKLLEEIIKTSGFEL